MSKTGILEDLETIKCGMVNQQHFDDAKVISDAMKYMTKIQVGAEASDTLIEDTVRRSISKEEFFEEYIIVAVEKRDFLKTIIELRKEIKKLSQGKESGIE